MSELASTPAAARLPLEVWSMICLAVLNYPRSEEEIYWRYNSPLRVLRALSATCRFLRDATRPSLWRSVQVNTINELGRLRRVLKMSPSLCQLIKEFTFAWEYEPTMSDFDCYPEQEGTLLDLTFRDRWQLWSRYLEEAGMFVDIERDDCGLLRGFFYHRGRKFFQPGRPAVREGEMDDDDHKSYDFDAPTQASGPDGRGEDALIKKPGPLISFLVDVVEMLTSLHTMKWSCAVMPIPIGVLNALEKLTTLKTLTLRMDLVRNNVHALPYWKLVRNLESLSIEHEYTGKYYSAEVSYEIQEESLASYQIPAHLPSNLLYEGWVARAQVNCGVIKRTVVAAARTGNLRHLRIERIHAPFAVRALLPSWVKVQMSWECPWQWHKWHGAARSLRPLLAHVSLWLGRAATSGPRQDRTLTATNVQSLRSHLNKNGASFCLAKSWKKPGFDNPLELYLPWLEGDAKLAQEVADAWNEVREDVDSDLIKCICERCRARVPAIEQYGEKER